MLFATGLHTQQPRYPHGVPLVLLSGDYTFDCWSGYFVNHHDNRVPFGYDWVPMHSENSKTNTRYGRVKAIGAGLVLAAVGFLRLLGGVQVVTHWTGQPMFSWGLIAAGIICILSAFIPNSWVARAVGTNTSKRAR